MKSCAFVLCWIGVNFLAANAYKAGVIVSPIDDVTSALPLVQEAGEKDVDILVLPTDVNNSEETYDDTVKSLSGAAKKAGLYLVAHLNEVTMCQKKKESVRSNLVFDRQGTVVAVYRKPTTNIANCSSSVGPSTFDTDFGVSFGLMMEEDLALRSPGSGLKDYVVAGAWVSEIPFLSAAQLTSAWAYVADARVLSAVGIFAGRGGIRSGAGSLVIADLNVDKVSPSSPPVVTPASIKNFPGEDLSQYIFRPLDVDTSNRGHKEAVCHNNFCCQFDVKTRSKGAKQEASYGLAVFNGIRHFGGRRYIGAQTCAVFACAGLYKRTCRIGSVNNDTSIVFEKLSIAAEFTKENAVQYPVIIAEAVPADKFSFVTETQKNSKQITIEVQDTDNLLAFGIFGRDFESDYENLEYKSNEFDIYDYIFTEDLQEIFDYLWIRVRVLLFIVSIYILEMM